MSVDNCKICNNLYYSAIGKDRCDKCFELELKDLEKVKKYLKMDKNKQSTFESIIENTGTCSDNLIKFIREKRLIIAGYNNLGYQCESCSNLIQDGIICNSCKINLKNELNKHENKGLSLNFKSKKDRKVFYSKNLY